VAAAVWPFAVSTAAIVVVLLLQADSRRRRSHHRDTTTPSTTTAATTTTTTTTAAATTTATATESVPWPADADGAVASRRWRVGHTCTRARWLFLRFARSCRDTACSQRLCVSSLSIHLVMLLLVIFLSVKTGKIE